MPLFFVTVEKYLDSQFVQPTSAQIETTSIALSTGANAFVQIPSAQIVQMSFEQMHREILRFSIYNLNLCITAKIFRENFCFFVLFS